MPPEIPPKTPPEFDRYANEYASLLKDPIRDMFAPGSTFFFERKWQLLLEYMGGRGMRPKESHWLDVGCGQGDLLRLGASSFAKASGCDLSSEMVRSCAGLNVVIQNDPLQLPFDSGAFDLVTAVCVYHHVLAKDRPILTAELARVLKPGGTACIIEHNPFNPATQLIVRRTPVDADAHLLTARTAKGLLAASHLTHARTSYFLYLPKSLYLRWHRVESFLERVPGGGQYAVFSVKESG